MKVESLKPRLRALKIFYLYGSVAILILASAANARAQQVSSTTLTLGPDQLGVIKTASKFSTRISFREPVKEVICGDLYDPSKGTGSFVIQQIDNEVYIKPLASKGMSNMFVKIGDKGNRTFNFDLVIVPPKEAHFIVNILSSTPEASPSMKNSSAKVSAPTGMAQVSSFRLPLLQVVEINPLVASASYNPEADHLFGSRFLSTMDLADPPPPPAARRTKPDPLPLGHTVSQFTPDYPLMAKMFGVYGEVVVSIKVNEKGKVESAKVLSGHIALREAAIYAARRLRYAPLKEGEPSAKRSGTITFNFKRPAT